MLLYANHAEKTEELAAHLLQVQYMLRKSKANYNYTVTTVHCGQRTRVAYNFDHQIKTKIIQARITKKISESSRLRGYVVGLERRLAFSVFAVPEHDA